MEMSCGSFAAQLLAMVGLLEGRRVPEMEFSVETNVGGESILFVRLLTTLSVEAFRLGCDAASLGGWCPTFRDHVVHELFD